MHIETAKQAADVINGMAPAKIKMLVDGLRAQHPHLKGKTDAEIRKMLGSFVRSNR